MTTSSMRDLLAQMAIDPRLARRVQGLPPGVLAAEFGLTTSEAERIAAVRIDGAKPAPRRLEERLSRSGLIFGGELAMADLHLSGQGTGEADSDSDSDSGSSDSDSDSKSSESGSSDSDDSDAKSSDSGDSDSGNDSERSDSAGSDADRDSGSDSYRSHLAKTADRTHLADALREQDRAGSEQSDSDTSSPGQPLHSSLRYSDPSRLSPDPDPAPQPELAARAPELYLPPNPPDPIISSLLAERVEAADAAPHAGSGEVALNPQPLPPRVGPTPDVEAVPDRDPDDADSHRIHLENAPDLSELQPEQRHEPSPARPLDTHREIIAETEQDAQEPAWRREEDRQQMDRERVETGRKASHLLGRADDEIVSGVIAPSIDLPSARLTDLPIAQLAKPTADTGPTTQPSSVSPALSRAVELNPQPLPPQLDPDTSEPEPNSKASGQYGLQQLLATRNRNLGLLDNMMEATNRAASDMVGKLDPPEGGETDGPASGRFVEPDPERTVGSAAAEQVEDSSDGDAESSSVTRHIGRFEFTPATPDPESVPQPDPDLDDPPEPAEKATRVAAAAETHLVGPVVDPGGMAQPRAVDLPAARLADVPQFRSAASISDAAVRQADTPNVVRLPQDRSSSDLGAAVSGVVEARPAPLDEVAAGFHGPGGAPAQQSGQAGTWSGQFREGWGWSGSEEGSFSAGPFTGSGQVSGYLGAFTHGQASATVGPDGAQGQASAEATAGVGGQAGGTVTAGPVKATGQGEADAGAQGRANAGGSVGADGADLKVGGRVFAGAGAETGGKVDLGVGGAEYEAGLRAGVGAGADLDVEISGDRVGFEWEADLALGLGLKVKFGVHVDPGEIADAGEEALETALEAGEDAVNTAVEAGEEAVKTVVKTGEAVVGALEDFFGLGDDDPPPPPDPRTLDSDRDGINDFDETQMGTDPRNADSDGDNIPDLEETQRGTSATDADSDHDGLPDEGERLRGTDPNTWDTDGDGYSDQFEIWGGTNPKSTDSDGDGIDDRREGMDLRTSPKDADSDDDGIDDGNEIRMGTDPRDPNSGPDVLREHMRKAALEDTDRQYFVDTGPDSSIEFGGYTGPDTTTKLN